MEQPKQVISHLDAIEQLAKGLELNGLTIEGELEITKDYWEENLTVKNCTVESFKVLMTQFKKPVLLLNTHFKNCAFPFTYFLKGLRIENCTFDQPFDLQSGGHNDLGHQILINNNVFHGFVDFVDCWFTGEIVVNNNIFKMGTNIESQKQYLTFDIPPIIFNNTGRTDIEAELEK